jgi:hypothetical protein
MKRTLLAIIAAVVLPATSVKICRADDLEPMFKKVTDLVAAKNYTKALEELSWAKKEIEKMNAEKLKSFLPDTLAGYTGGKVESNNALGMLNLERSYSNGTGQFKLSLTGGAGGNAAGFGDLAAIGRMAAMMGNQGGQDTFRIGGRTATLEARDDSKGGELTVFLDSGSILKLEGNNIGGTQTLRDAANALKLDDLDNYLKGQG